jgi:hypothetical protein
MAYMITAKEGQLTEKIFKITVETVSANMLTKKQNLHFLNHFMHSFLIFELFDQEKRKIIILFYFLASFFYNLKIFSWLLASLF